MTDPLPSPPDRAPDRAKARFIMLSLLRFTAAAMVFGGMILAFGSRNYIAQEVSKPLGYALIIIGFLDLVVVVPLLTRRWRSPPAR